jgi:Tfp pilus assembly protein PilF
MMMRITAISAAAALLLLSVSTSLMAQRPDDQIDPKSLALLQEGKAARAAGNLDGAQDALESALAVDPRNREAFVVLAGISTIRGLPGKAIRLYHEALALDPNDTAALRGQGEAMVVKGATEKAKENLAKIRTLCKGNCADATTLAAAIGKGPPSAATAQAAPAPAPSAQPSATPN